MHRKRRPRPPAGADSNSSRGMEPAKAPQDVASADAVKDMMDRYSAATADRVLSPLFDKVERDTFGCVKRGIC